MLFYEETKLELNLVLPKLNELSKAISYDETKKQIQILEENSSVIGFWDDTKKSQEITQKLNLLKNVAESYDKLLLQYDDLQTLLDMAIEENDETVANEIKDDYLKFKNDLESQQLQTLLRGEYDSKNAILTFHAGAGGTEAQDWVCMLLRMYTKWADHRGYKIKTLDYLNGDEAGLKSVTVLVEGLNAYGYLHGEGGVHRLVRISPFDSSGRRHTTFASLEVMPEIDENVEINIKPEDLKIDTYRASGAGGQHVNTTDSAVRITHIPTGVVCACQNERSQFQNKDMAMKMLLSKLVEIKKSENLEKIEDIKGVQKEIAWGMQIRSYVFMPYTLVKDHRTKFENGNVNAIMDGDIDGFINAYLTAKSRKEL